MAHLPNTRLRYADNFTRLTFFAIVFFALVLPASVLALAMGLGLLPLPYQLFLVLQRLPVLFPLHMIASGLSLLMIPIAAFTRHRRLAHRAAGRVAVICVTVGGLTALFVALASEASATARAGFFMQALCWLTLTAAAIAAIRAGNRALHARLMIAMASVASGALWLRLIMAAVVACEIPFQPAYTLAAWACWSIPMAMALAARPLHSETI